MSDRNVLECSGLLRTFSEGPADVDVLKGIDFSVKAGEQVAIIGSVPCKCTPLTVSAATLSMLTRSPVARSNTASEPVVLPATMCLPYGSMSNESRWFVSLSGTCSE